jgi:hypothetical protein
MIDRMESSAKGSQEKDESAKAVKSFNPDSSSNRVEEKQEATNTKTTK